jgi:hypothetical protein
MKSLQDKQFQPWNEIEDLKDPFMANRVFILDDVEIQETISISMATQVFGLLGSLRVMGQ